MLELFNTDKEVLETCRKNHRYIMVDEYQDTNGKQFQLLKALASEHQNVCVVGDDDQSIYGWRGAEIANLLHLEDHFPGIRVIKLEQNYRSNNTILKAANAVIRHNPLRKDKTLWSSKGEGPLIQLMVFETEEAEAQAVAEGIEVQRLSKRIPWNHQAILFRTNLQARPLETALRQSKIAYRLVGSQSYFDRREVKDILAFLVALINPDDDISLLRIANVPARGLSAKTMQTLLQLSQDRNTSVWSVMHHSDLDTHLRAAASKSSRGFVSLIEDQRRFLKEENKMAWPIGLAVSSITSVISPNSSIEKDPKIAENRMQSAQELVSSIDSLTASMGSVKGKIA